MTLTLTTPDTTADATQLPVIELRQARLTHPDGDTELVAVNDVDLNLDRGQVTALTGPSGSGKSSLLSLAATLVTPTSGTVLVDGQVTTDLDQAQRAALRRNHIGIVFQQSNLIPSLTAVEQLVVMGELNGPDRRTRPARRERAAALLDQVGLMGRLDHLPHQLSGGQRQRVNIARALMNQPGALLVDEPTAALDSVAGRQVMDLIVDLTHRLGVATLLVTHDVEYLPLVDRSFTMVDGVLTAGVEGAA